MSARPLRSKANAKGMAWGDNLRIRLKNKAVILRIFPLEEAPPEPENPRPKRKFCTFAYFLLEMEGLP
jgi:hypothetical protein